MARLGVGWDGEDGRPARYGEEVTVPACRVSVPRKCRRARRWPPDARGPACDRLCTESVSCPGPIPRSAWRPAQQPAWPSEWPPGPPPPPAAHCRLQLPPSRRHQAHQLAWHGWTPCHDSVATCFCFPALSHGVRQKQVAVFVYPTTKQHGTFHPRHLSTPRKTLELSNSHSCAGLIGPHEDLLALNLQEPTQEPIYSSGRAAGE